jgi:hypothetical protein
MTLDIESGSCFYFTCTKKTELRTACSKKKYNHEARPKEKWEFTDILYVLPSFFIDKTFIKDSLWLALVYLVHCLVPCLTTVCHLR